MSKYRVEHLGRSGPPPQIYRYAIWAGADKVAEFEHDFRNDDRWFRIDGVSFTCAIDVLSGGGTQPLGMTKAGSELLDRLLAQ